MRTAILVVWAIGLLGAVPATLTVLKLAQLVVSALLDIGRLAMLTRDAARRLAQNVALVPTLPDLGVPARQLAHDARQVASAMRLIDEHLAEL